MEDIKESYCTKACDTSSISIYNVMIGQWQIQWTQRPGHDGTSLKWSTFRLFAFQWRYARVLVRVSFGTLKSTTTIHWYTNGCTLGLDKELELNFLKIL